MFIHQIDVRLSPINIFDIIIIYIFIKKVCVCLPVCHPLLQLPQQVSVQLVELWQVIQDLAEDPLINHRLPILTGCLGNSIPEVLERHRG